MTFLKANRQPKGKMRILPFWLLFCIATTSFFSLPAWARDASCQFRAKGFNLAFGTLDPSSNVAVSKPAVMATTFADMAGDCNVGGTMTISLVGSSSRQLVSLSSGGTINYTLTSTGLPVTLAQPGNAPPGNPANGYTTWFTPNQLQGTIQWSAYADAPAATDYTDSIIISVTP
jgi:hypothetical protein